MPVVPHTAEGLGAFCASRIAHPVTVVRDGLRCLCATTIVGAEHQRRPVSGGGGGKGSVMLPQFKSTNTLLCSLETAIGSPYLASDFAMYAPR